MNWISVKDRCRTSKGEGLMEKLNCHGCKWLDRYKMDGNGYCCTVAVRCGGITWQSGALKAAGVRYREED